AWEWSADPGVVVRTVGAAAGATRRGADFEGPLVDWRAKGSHVRLGEPETIGGRPAHRLTLTHADGFVRELFVDVESCLEIAERRTAPIHAFGAPVTSETRIGDHRPVAGVLFAHSYLQTEIATGETLSRMQWGRIEANRELPPAWFSPPEFERTPLQRFLELLYAQRTDVAALLASYRDFRRSDPRSDPRPGVEWIGYQLLKMGEAEEAIALLALNADDHPGSASAAFSLGRAFETAGQDARARLEYLRALELDPDERRAAAALAALEARPAVGNPLSFLEPFIGSWRPDPGGELVAADPTRADDVAFRLEWADPRRKILRFYEGIPDGDLDRRVLENLVTFDPRSGEIRALGLQLVADFLYESTFLPGEGKGFVRDYRVTYPPQQRFRHEEDRERGWIRYRDRCRLTAPDRLHCVTEQMRGGEWQSWGAPDGYTLVRR
ncbi:MAG: tetratricopeptide repeat protein, partial [Thermoanaerobaculia bacterium]|nr:tetratricopeptide repeat protein [Thermoanaerobaculia bacterium]